MTAPAATAPDRPLASTQHRLMVVDDHPVVRAGMRSLLATSRDITIVAEAADREAAIAAARRTRPTAALVDVNLGDDDGVRLVGDLCRLLGPRFATVMMSVDTNPATVLAALNRGARGYLLKSSSPASLAQMLRIAASGGVVVDPQLGPGVAEMVGRGTPARQTPLSPREVEVLRAMSRGLTNAEIAGLLVVSPETVRTHVKAVLRKLGARDRTHAVLIALGHPSR